MKDFNKTASSSIYLDTSDLMDKIGKFDNYGKILGGAMSKTKGKFKTELSRNIRDVYAIRKDEVDTQINVNYKTVPPSITATVKGRRFTLGCFLVGNFKPGKPVKVRVKKGKTSSIASPTFANTISGRPQVARRVGATRLPIEVLRTVSVAQMAENTDVYDKVLSGMKKTLFAEIEKQHKRFISEK